jgi:hypothetical protein
MKVTMLSSGLALGALIALGSAHAQQSSEPAPAGAPGRPTIEFKTVAQALAALKADSNIHITLTEGPDVWTIAAEPDDLTQWSFTPAGHPAHPAVVKRVISRGESGDVYVVMATLCEAEKPACDALIQDFRATNEYMRQALQRSSRQSRSK